MGGGGLEKLDCPLTGNQGTAAVITTLIFGSYNAGNHLLTFC